MNFYKNVIEHRGKLLVRGIHDGKEYKEKIDYSPTLYAITQQKTDFQTLNGQYVKPIQFGNKFIIYIVNNEINVVHQRRAHKRILYEKILKMKKGFILSQKLLFEKIIEFSIDDVKIIENIQKKLNNIGFLIKIKDVNKVEFNSIPNNLKESDIKSTIEDIIELHKQNENENTKINSEIAIALSNKLAIKSSRNLNILEMNDLIKQLFACENQYTCPSGKKIIKKITNSEIENNF